MAETKPSFFVNDLKVDYPVRYSKEIKELDIEVCENGYFISAIIEAETGAKRKPFIFTSFTEMSNWLEYHLARPKK